MAYETSQGFKITLVAGADLTSAAYQWVKLNASGQAVLCTAITDKPAGVLQNAPKATEECEVVVQGVSKLVGAAALAVDALLGTDAASKAKAIVPGTDTTAYTVGRVIKATGGANELVTAFVDCAVPNRAS
jgi:hypothetical protein